MANSQNVGIANSWSLVAFAQANGTMKVTDDLTNSETGEVFKSCAFISPAGAVTMVGFSSKLDTINTKNSPSKIAQQIAAQKDELQVVKLSSGSYKLCKKGEDNWTEVNLGL